MNIRQALIKDHNKSGSKQIVQYILNNPDSMDDLMECFFDDSLRICQWASGPVVDLSEENPALLLPYLSQMIDQLKSPKHDAIIRNIIRTWQGLLVPEEFQGQVFDICYDYLTHPKTAVAIRAFSMTVCCNICKSLPELREELILVIEDQMEFGSTGIKNRGEKMLKILRDLS